MRKPENQKKSCGKPKKLTFSHGKPERDPLLQALPGVSDSWLADLKKKLAKENDGKNDGFFLQNIFICCLMDQENHVLLTDYCQFYGFPLTSHVISAQIKQIFLGPIFGQNNIGCQWELIKLTVIG